MAWVLLHGFLGRPSLWDRVRSALPAEAPVLAPILYGHGQVPPVAPKVAFDDEVDRIAGLVTQAGLEDVVLVGYSLGARLGLRLLVRHPRLFRRAVLIGAHAGLEGDATRTDRRRGDLALAEQVECEGLDAFVDAWERRDLFVTQGHLPESILDAQRAIRRSHLADGIAASLRSLGLAEMPNTWPALPEVTVPVAVMVGELDAKFRAVGERLAANLPRGELVVVPGVGHNVVLEAPVALVPWLRHGAAS